MRSAIAPALAILAAASVLAQAPEGKKPEPKRPSLSVKATPGTGMVPVRILVAAELKGGDDDFEAYYCPTIEWSWGDGTSSEETKDCEPYEVGKSQIKRRYSVFHNYKRAGAYRISFRLKDGDKVLAATTTVVRLLGGGY
ncbi:MAG: hypothetical protein ND807_11490 [Vicinamibacterales bacterium]|nr:hypothetical protein [Vicinamibacterales bacterium]